jgi:hypothetical protein
VSKLGIPTYAMYGKYRVRILGYRGDGEFHVLMPNDATEWIDRRYLRFLPAKKG